MVPTVAFGSVDGVVIDSGGGGDTVSDIVLNAVRPTVSFTVT
jgi:hypothetical protein